MCDTPAAPWPPPSQIQSCTQSQYPRGSNRRIHSVRPSNRQGKSESMPFNGENNGIQSEINGVHEPHGAHLGDRSDTSESHKRFCWPKFLLPNAVYESVLLQGPTTINKGVKGETQPKYSASALPNPPRDLNPATVPISPFFLKLRKSAYGS
jgi:hypothetical protein